MLNIYIPKCTPRPNQIPILLSWKLLNNVELGPDTAEGREACCSLGSKQACEYLWVSIIKSWTRGSHNGQGEWRETMEKNLVKLNTGGFG